MEFLGILQCQTQNANTSSLNIMQPIIQCVVKVKNTLLTP
jgi:hypothetical protein